MNKIIIILLVLISLFSSSAFAQIDADISRPSVNAEQFGFDLKAETALNKGQLSLNIPLMTLKGKGYDLPISLSFYSGDVNCTTEASPIGLGWALMAGGVITTTVRGTEDIEDYMQDGKDDHHTDGNYIENSLNSTSLYDLIDRIRLNPMPDEYTYSLPGHSGTIEVSLNDNSTINRALFPDESYKIENATNGYCITADDGTKFYFEDQEQHVTGTWPESQKSTSYFLTRIETAKGGFFNFTYASESYCDLSKTRDYVNDWDCDIYHTKRITRIASDFGSITFDAVERDDRGDAGRWRIPTDKKSKRICKIELRDENNQIVKGYEIDNSGTFKLEDKKWEEPSSDWYNYRHMLSTITQYDAAGNRLPPYEFTYDYRFSKSRMQYLYNDKDSEGNYIPYDSWTTYTGGQVYVDLYGNPDKSRPYCWINNNAPNSWPTGWFQSPGGGDPITTDDYFCLNRIYYPTGAIDTYIYEPHRYSKINDTEALPDYSTKIQGRRLATKKHYSSGLTQRTDYVYKRHDANYNTTGSSGVLTNPSIHSATYYTPEYTVNTLVHSYGWVLRASRVSSGKPFNSFMGPPVCYTEVEVVEKDEYGYNLNRTIYYFEPQIVSPPVNYVLIQPQQSMPELIKIENRIFGKKSGYSNGMVGCNNVDYTYLAYPVGEFYNTALLVDKPLKEVFIGNDDKVRSIKKYLYDTREENIAKKYGYKVVSPENSNYTMISKSEYITRRIRLRGTATTSYYYDGNMCDSICEEYQIRYNKGRTKNEYYSRDVENSSEVKSSQYFYPDDVNNIAGNNTSPMLAAVNGLIEKNMIADPIKITVRRNDMIVSGECRGYQMPSGIPLLKSLYKIKNTTNKYSSTPTISGDTIDYHAELYREGEVMTYDAYLNPEYVRLNDTLDRIYVWGYGGRYPIAVIDNMNGTTFQSMANLKAKILELQSYKKIETEDDCTRLRSTNVAIRNMLPAFAHITTYTYDPYFGMTSETDASNLGTIFTYDTFGRLTAKYDVDYKKLEEYNYHFKLQQ